MKKLLLFFIVFFAASCEKSEYVNPYYTKEQLSVIETLYKNVWVEKISGGVCRFYTINNKPFDIWYSGKNRYESVDGFYMFRFPNFVYNWAYFKLNFDDANNVIINVYHIEQSRIDIGTNVADKVDWIISTIPATAPNVFTTDPSPLQIWKEQGIKYISFYGNTYYSE